MYWGRLFQMWGPKCEKVWKPCVLQLKCWVWACMCLMKSGESRKNCKGVAAQKDKREWNLWLHWNTCKQFCILFFQKLGACGVAVGEVCSFDGVELWEWGVQQYFGLAASVDDIYLQMILFHRLEQDRLITPFTSVHDMTVRQNHEEKQLHVTWHYGRGLVASVCSLRRSPDSTMTVQLYCLCVETFDFWLLIHIKQSIHFKT